MQNLKLLKSTFEHGHNLPKINPFSPTPKKKRGFLEEFHLKPNPTETNINSSSLNEKKLFTFLKGPTPTASKTLEVLDNALISRINGYNERLGALIQYGPGSSYAGRWNNSNPAEFTNFMPTATFKPNSVHLLICQELAPLLDAYYRKIFQHALNNSCGSTYKESIKSLSNIRKFFFLCEETYPDAFHSVEYLQNLFPPHVAISQLYWAKNNSTLQYRNILSDPICIENDAMKNFQELNEPQQICFYSTRFKHQLNICDELIKQPQTSMDSRVFEVSAAFPMPIKIEKRTYLESYIIEDDDDVGESLLVVKQQSKKTNSIFSDIEEVFTTILDALKAFINNS